MPPELSHVHVQRIRGAVEAAKRGARVEFRVFETQPKTIGWRDLDKKGTRHVIANSFGDGILMLLAIETKYQEMLLEK